MTKKQIEHAERKLINVIDRVARDERATAEKLQTLPGIVDALLELHKAAAPSKCEVRIDGREIAESVSSHINGGVR